MRKINKLRLIILIILLLLFATFFVSVTHVISFAADDENLNQTQTFEVVEDDGIYDLTVLNEKIKTSVTVTKEWDDNDDEYGIRPSEVYVTLNATSDGAYKLPYEIEATVALSEDNEWTYTWEDLYKYDDDDNEIKYSVEEENLEGNLANVFERTIEKTDEYDDGLDSYENWTITNTYTGCRDFTEKMVTKVWNDTETQAKKRPSTIKFVLYKQSGSSVMEVADEYELNTEEEDSHLFENLPVYDECGNKITYIIEEEKDDNYYNTMIDNENGVITNTFSFDQRYITITAKKDWEDSDLQALRRPDNIKFVLMNGENEVETLVACEENDWTVTFGEFINIEKYDENADEIPYTVKEVEIEDDDLHFYKSDGVANIVEDEGGNFAAKITNTFVVPDDTKDVKITKIWNDNDNKNETRPDNVTVYVMGNGITYEITLTDSMAADDDQNCWIKTVSLPEYDENGVEIEYVLTDELYVDGYESDLSKADRNIVTNTVIPAETNIKTVSTGAQGKDEPVDYELGLPYTGTNSFIVTVLTVIGIISMIIGIAIYRKEN